MKTSRASRAYFNHNRWVVECPEPDCSDARLVYEEDPRTGEPTGRRLTGDTCANGHPFQIEMPDEQTEAQVVTVLAERPDEADRSWFPTGHERAIAGGHPHGQGVAELKRENKHVAEVRARRDERRKQELAEALAKLGVTVRPDGSFEGKI